MRGKQIMEKSTVKHSKVDEELREIIEKGKAKIKVVGCGGAGGNAITRLMRVGIVGAQTIVINTDAQALLYTDSDLKILIGRELTGGLGAGKNPKIGMESAKENKDDIKKTLKGADMVFITCGLGGGTGTGSAPIVADIARKIGALTVAITTLPFAMEGRRIYENARGGLENLEGVTDTLIVIPNDRLLEIVPDVSIPTAFRIADEILVNSVKGIAELVTKPGLVNLDFADVRAVMGDGGLAMIGMGESNTDNRATEAVEKALNNPLISVDVEGAKGALINVMGGPDITIREAQQIVESVGTKLSPEAKIIWGAHIAKEMKDSVRALLIITGVTSPQIFGPGKPWSKQQRKDIEKILGVDFVS